MYKLTADILLDRDPEFSFKLTIIETDSITITNPYKYSKSQWIEYYNKIVNDVDFIMDFDGPMIERCGINFILIDGKHKIEFRTDSFKQDMLDCFNVVIDSHAIKRYKYFTKVRTLL